MKIIVIFVILFLTHKLSVFTIVEWDPHIIKLNSPHGCADSKDIIGMWM